MTLINLDSRGTNGSFGSFEKIHFLSLSVCASDTEDAAHLYLLPKPTEPLCCPGISMPRTAPGGQDYPDKSQRAKLIAQPCGFFSDMFPRNIDFYGINSLSLDSFFIPTQVCLQKLVSCGFVVQSLAFLFYFGYWTKASLFS